ncbi:MAG: cation:proton antiporter [Anaerolineales bacterium]|nr:cation:proton antiporter [Anaerolineales bacterium]
MENILTSSIYIASFTIIAFASKQIGTLFNRFKLPLISGFLFTGLIAGPYVLGLIQVEAIERLRFIDEIALAVIAFAAGNELYIKELRDRMRSISWIIAGQIIFTFPLTVIAVLLLADFLPFMESMPFQNRLAIALLGGAILVARSPSSAIAIVNELRARGPFTKTILGVTMVMDVVVIILFGINSSVADSLLTNLPFNLGFVALLVFELSASIGLGYLLYRGLLFILSAKIHQYLKPALILVLGYGVFLFSAYLREITHRELPFEILIEPLLICMIGGFLISSFSNYRDDFSRILHRVAPVIYILFFTLTGASLALDVLFAAWPIALALFAVRLLGIFVGSFSGGVIAKDPMPHNRLGWMAYVTQAGVGLGLAKEVAVEFPGWGEAFATVVIAVIVVNQIVGPPFFKWVINRVGESHLRATPAAFDGVRDALIFGLRPQSITLARQLQRHDWQVKLVCLDASEASKVDAPDIEVELVNTLDLETLQALDGAHADAIVSFLPNDLSYQVFEIAYEHFGTNTLVARLRDCIDYERFQKLGVLVVEPQTAVISLLEHFVRAPVGTSLLLGRDEDQSMIDQEVRNPNLTGLTLRDLRLPLDVLVLSIERDRHTLVARGFTKFEMGDRVTMVGPRKKLEEVALRFDA